MELVPSLQAGSQFGDFCFSHDSRYLFCCCGIVVKVFNTVNGQCIHDLRAHSKVVTGVALNSSNVLQILTCSRDGCLIFWDYLDGAKLKEHNLHMPLIGIVSVNAEKKSLMMIAQTSEHKKTFSLLQWKKKKTTNEFAKPKMLVESCDGDRGLVSFGCSREFVASGLNHELTIYSMKNESSRFVSDNDKYNRNKAITCVACHPSEYVIATGLENGMIVLWHSFFKDTQPVTSTVHWHALPVLCLDFTPDGSNFLSGGHECVLVRWQMGNTRQRDYKPRMGTPLTQVHISPDGNLYATKHSDNVIQLLDINLKILQAYRGLTLGNICGKTNANPIPCGLNFDMRSRALVTNGLPGHLQFYSLTANKQLFNLDIVGQNYISPENMDRPKDVTEITSTAISSDGQWLATFEMWNDGFFTPELRLKFWQWSSQAQMYSLNTTVETPHDGKIIMMTFRPSVPSNQKMYSPTLVTVGDDRYFKLWVQEDDSDIYRSNTRWNCDSVGTYRGLRASCADFSRDGSTLAVAFEHLITLWDPENNVVRTSLSNSLPGREHIITMKFGSHQCRHRLVVVTTKHLLSWDLLTLRIHWSINTETCILFRDPASDLMAFITKKRTLNVFSPRTCEPIYKLKNLSASEVLDAVFVPDGRCKRLHNIGWRGRSQIYIFNKEQELLTLDFPAWSIKKSRRVKIAQNLPATAMSAIMAEKVARDGDEPEVNTTAGRSRTADDSYVSMLLHSNEPVSTHCDQYLTSLLEKRKSPGTGSQEMDSAETDGMQEEDSSSSESEMETEDSGYCKNQSPNKPETQSREQSLGSNPWQDEDNMDKLLTESADWIQWCASLKLQ